MSASTTDAAAAERATVVVVLCFLSALCEGIDLQAAGVTAAGIRKMFQPDTTWLTYFFAASTLGLFIGAMIGGRLSDRHGRKAVLVWSIALFGLFSLLTPLASSIQTLTLMRFLTGLGLGGALPNIIAMGSESAPSDRRNAYVSIIYAGTPLGGALASLISLVTPLTQWRWVYIAGGIVPLLLAPIIARSMPESRLFSRLGAAGAAKSGNSTDVIEFLREGRLLRTLLLWVSFFLALLTLYLLLNWLPTLLGSSGLPKAAVAGSMIGFNIGGCLTGLFLGFHLESARRHVGVVLAFVSLPLLLALLAANAGAAGTMMGIVVLVGAAVVAEQAILYAYAPLCYPTAVRGTGVGAAVSVGRIGSIVGPMLGGLLVGSGRAPAQVLTGILPIVVAGSVCAIALAWRSPTVKDLE